MTRPIVEIVIEGPGMNALSTPLIRRLRDEFEAAGSAPVLLRGAGAAFSAGLDLKEVAGLDPQGMETFLRNLEALVGRMFDHEGPVVAAVNGHAIAGGAVLAMCCDAVVATTNPKARIGLNEVALGLQFPPIVLRAMTHRLDPRHRAEVLLGAALHRPEDALRLGIVDALDPDCDGAARTRLERLARHPPVAFAATKAALRAGVTNVSEPEYARFVREVVPAWTSGEVKARLRAALAR
jgi:enoyl-CoA hydratase